MCGRHGRGARHPPPQTTTRKSVIISRARAPPPPPHPCAHKSGQAVIPSRAWTRLRGELGQLGTRHGAVSHVPERTDACYRSTESSALGRVAFGRSARVHNSEKRNGEMVLRARGASKCDVDGRAESP